MFYRAVQIWRLSLGHTHANVAVGVANMASVLQEQGKLDEAVVQFRIALDIHRTALGDDHYQVAAALHNLAYALRLRDESSAEASELGRQALVVAERTLGATHPRTAHYRKEWGATNQQ